eukprot:4146858-Prymnesium_polylepis.1
MLKKPRVRSPFTTAVRACNVSASRRPPAVSRHRRRFSPPAGGFPPSPPVSTGVIHYRERTV